MRVIGSEGNQLGVLPLRDALMLAQRDGLDLVEISPNAQPPVCKIINFGKFRYELSKKEKESRKNQHATKLKELKYHANIEEHDYQTKLRHIEDFLSKGMKVKATLVFRGREMAHTELGHQIMQRVIQDVANFGMVEVPPRLIGKAINMVLAARTKKAAGPVSGKPEQPPGNTGAGQARPNTAPVAIRNPNAPAQSSGSGFTNSPRIDLDRLKPQS